MRLRLTLTTVLTTLGLLVLPAVSFGADDINFASATIVNSPREIATWPATAKLTSVEFRDGGWKVEFDRRLANPWPDFIIPGWSGPIQYTLGMCLDRGGWRCSAVVQMWRARNEEEGFAAAGGVDKIAQDWFYDPQWGPLYRQQPALGESVAIFVMAGDGRRIGTAWSGSLHERSDVRVIRWGVSQAFINNEPPEIPNTPPAPPTPTPEPPTQDPTLALLTARVKMLETTIDSLNAQIAELVAGQKRVDDYLAGKPIPATCKASVFGIPVSCSIQ